MISSYRFSQEHNLQSILWAIGGAIVGSARLLSAIVGRVSAIVSHFDPFCASLWGLWALVAPDMALIINAALWAFLWSVAACAVLGALFLILSNPLIIIGAGIIGAFGWVTYPRSKVATNGR